MDLTKEELDQLDMWLRVADVGNMHVERPVVPATAHPLRTPVGVVLGGEARLSRATRLSYEKKAAKAERHKAAVKKRASKVKRGQYHHNSKKATKRRQAMARWATQPYKSLVYGYGNWAITQEEWDEHIGDLWTLYEAEDLSVKRKWGMGTKANPYTIYHLTVVHSKLGVVFSGEDLLIYHSSQPNELDIEKAPEGALLFTSLYLSLREYKSTVTLNKLYELLFPRKLQTA